MVQAGIMSAMALQPDLLIQEEQVPVQVTTSQWPVFQWPEVMPTNAW